MMGAKNQLSGTNNWVVGANHNLKGSNIRMFGPNADPKYLHGSFTSEDCY